MPGVYANHTWPNRRNAGRTSSGERDGDEAFSFWSIAMPSEPKSNWSKDKVMFILGEELLTRLLVAAGPLGMTKFVKDAVERELARRAAEPTT
jgi:hypothetical protein